MKFAGHSNGELTLGLSSELLDTLAENMLGEPVEGEDGREKAAGCTERSTEHDLRQFSDSMDGRCTSVRSESS